MEDFKKKNTAEGDKEIVFSKAIKAGKRIYYLDVRKNRKDEMFLAITESKKIVSGEGESSQVSFEKHKIFLYKEDFAKLLNGLTDVMRFVEKEQGEILLNSNLVEPNEVVKEEFQQEEKEEFPSTDEIKIDIDF